MNLHPRQHSRSAITLALLLLLLPGSGCQRTTPASRTKPASDTGDSTHGAHDHDHDHDHDHAHDHGHGHGHGHHDDPADSLPTAVARVRVLLESVETHFAQGTPEQADDALHELGTLTERLPGLAAETDLPETEWAKVRESASRLYEQLDRIHAEFHTDGKIDLDYATVKSAIDAELSTLAAVVAQLPAADTNETDGDVDENEESPSDRR